MFAKTECSDQWIFSFKRIVNLRKTSTMQHHMGLFAGKPDFVAGRPADTSMQSD